MKSNNSKPNKLELTREQKCEKIEAAIDALIDVAEDLGFNSHEIKNVWVDKLRMFQLKVENP